MSRRFAVVAALLVAAAPAPAAVVVLANYTPNPVAFTLTHPGQSPKAETLAGGQVKPFDCGPRIDVRFTAAGSEMALQLDPYEVYVFTEVDQKLVLSGIELAGKAVPPADIRPFIEPPKPVTIAVKVLVDDADRRTKRAWEATLRRRFAQAADQIAAQCPVRFTLTTTEEWFSDPAALDLDGVMKGFKRKVVAAPADLAIGFTSRLPAKAGEAETMPVFGQAAVLQPHVVIREGEPKNESERVEVLTRYLATYLGAVTSPDPASALRSPLGDGKAISPKFRVQLDPLNVLAVNLWAESLRLNPATKPAELPAATKARLLRVYQTLVNAQPDEPVPAVIAALNPDAVVVRPPDAPPAVEPKAAEPKAVEPQPTIKTTGGEAKADTTRVDAVRKVVKAVVFIADDNAGNAKLRGDALTNLYIRTAAATAKLEEPDLQAAAFLLGLGIALDDSEILRKNLLAGKFCQSVESDEERKHRLSVLGTPTVLGRRDLCQHFVVSAYLTEAFGAGPAEVAGLAKEQSDMARPSGFSFTDLCADLAGIEFAKLVKKRPAVLEEYPQAFGIAAFVPKMDGLRDGLSAERFKADYGAVGDDRFKAALEDVRKRVAALPAYAK